MLSSTWGSGCFGLAASCRQRRSAQTFLSVLESRRTSVGSRRLSVSGRHVVLKMQPSHTLQWDFQRG